jgi:hypothetical protein
MSARDELGGGVMNDCNDSAALRSWYDIMIQEPQDPASIFAFAEIRFKDANEEDVVVTGAPFRSLTYGRNSSAWQSDMALCSFPVPTCVANDSSDGVAISDADQWNFQHLTSIADPSRPPQLKNLVFVRAGLEWTTDVAFELLKGATLLELSLLTNAGTRGDAQGTIPVIRFTHSEFPEGTTIFLRVTVIQPCSVSVGLQSTASNGNSISMLAMNIIAVE